MCQFLFLLNLIVIFVPISPQPHHATGRIVGGTIISYHKYKFIVSVKYGNSFAHGCGGTIISPNVILTAAHCIYQMYPVSVAYGSNILNGNNIKNRVKSYSYHEYYNPETYRNDIGLLFLSDSITYNDKIQPVSLSTIKHNHQTVKVIGWGTINAKNEKLVSNELKVVGMEALYSNHCRMEMPRRERSLIGPSNVCTKGKKGKGDCQGDSGGPLLDKYDKQVGIVSWGIDCANKLPNVYTRIASYVKWINKETSLRLQLN